MVRQKRGNTMIELSIDTGLCTLCLDCVECCSGNALSSIDEYIIFSSGQCTYCEYCIDVCEPAAITIKEVD